MWKWFTSKQNRGESGPKIYQVKVHSERKLK